MEVVEEGRGPKVQESQGLWVQRSKGPEDQDISNSNSNTSLTLKKVHLVWTCRSYLWMDFPDSKEIFHHFTYFYVLENKLHFTVAIGTSEVPLSDC